MLGADGVIFTEPRQVPARVLSWSNDICASDGAALSVALCISDCAKATVANNMRAMGDTKRRDFIFILLKAFCFPTGYFWRHSGLRHQVCKRFQRKTLSTVIVDYNTEAPVKYFLYLSWRLRK